MNGSESNTVVVEKLDAITIVTINRPRARNAVDGPTSKKLFDAFAEFDADPMSNVAILTGASEMFCAGANLKEVATGDREWRHDAAIAPMGPTRTLLSKPVIAAVEGYAVAGGLELAAWCDLRVAAKDAKFGVFCRRWGVPLVDGGTVRLSRLLGHSRALDLILTGREVSGDEALQMGLANRLTESNRALEGAIELAQQLCKFPQLCMRNDRLSSYQQWAMPVESALTNEAMLGKEVMDSGETQAGAGRFANGKGRHGSLEI